MATTSKRSRNHRAAQPPLRLVPIERALRRRPLRDLSERVSPALHRGVNVVRRLLCQVRSVLRAGCAERASADATGDEHESTRSNHLYQERDESSASMLTHYGLEVGTATRNATSP
jgi:hypothetical protein